MLNIVYDLRVMPPTFDFPYFVALADARRRIDSRESGFILWLVTGGSRRPIGWDWGDEIRASEVESVVAQRLTRVIYPLSRLFPSIQKVNIVDETCFSDMDIPIFHPIDYSFRDPKLGIYHKGWFLLPYAAKIDLRCLANRAESLAEAERYLQNELGCSRPVIITTRNNVLSHDQSRNTRPEVLVELVSRLRGRGFTVGLIPDTSMQGVLPKSLGVRVLTAPAFDVILRSAVYECAVFCLFEPTGPLVLAQLNPATRFIAYGMAWSTKFDSVYQKERGYTEDVNFIAPFELKQQYLWSSLTGDRLERWLDEGGVVPV